MKKTTSFLAAFILMFNAFAQEPVFTWGALQAKPGAPAEVRILGYTSTGYYIVNKREPSELESRSIVRSAFSPVIHVEYINSEGRRVFSKDVSTGRADDYVDVVYFNNSLQVISALFDKDAGKNILTARSVNLDGSSDKSVKIGELGASKMSQRGLFYVNTSPDGSKLIELSQPEYVKDQNEKIGLSLYKEGFTQVWNAEKTFAYPWSKSVDNKPYVNNDGTAFILKQISMKGADDSWAVFSFAGKELKEFKMAIDNKKMSSFAQAFSSEGDFTIAGYYKEEGARIRVYMGDKANGSFLYRIDAAGQQMKTAAVNPFGKRSDIVARSLAFYENTVILLGEKYVVSDRAAARTASTPQTNETMFARDYTYNGMDIIVGGFDNTGKPIYNTTIDKDNSSKNDLGYWVSYFAAVVNGKLRIVFMDNFSRYDNRKISINTPNIIVYATIDPVTGSLEKPVPVSKPGPVGGKDGDSYMSPAVFLKTGDNKYIIRAENRNDYRMGQLVF